MINHILKKKKNINKKFIAQKRSDLNINNEILH